MTPYIALSWKNLIKQICKEFWYKVISQNWSHIKLKYFNWNSLIIPNHKEIKKWTFNSILDFISEDTWKTKKEIFIQL